MAAFYNKLPLGRLKTKSQIESQSQYLSEKSQLDYFPKLCSPKPHYRYFDCKLSQHYTWWWWGQALPYQYNTVYTVIFMVYITSYDNINICFQYNCSIVLIICVFFIQIHFILKWGDEWSKILNCVFTACQTMLAITSGL